MSYLVVGTKDGTRWDLEVQGVGVTRAEELKDIETAVRALLRREGRADAADADLQLLMPDFEVDLSESLMPRSTTAYVELISGVIALLVVVGAVVFAVARLA